MLETPAGLGEEVHCQGFNRLLNGTDVSDYEALGATLGPGDGRRTIVNDGASGGLSYETSGDSFVRVWRSRQKDVDDAHVDHGNVGLFAAPRVAPSTGIARADGVVRARVGGGHACLFFDSGLVECWGAASTGQLGPSHGSAGDYIEILFRNERTALAHSHGPWTGTLLISAYCVAVPRQASRPPSPTAWAGPRAAPRPARCGPPTSASGPGRST